MSMNRNYVPHSKWGAVRSFDNQEEYMERLAIEVKAACDRWFARKGIITSYQQLNSQRFNAQQKQQANN